MKTFGVPSLVFHLLTLFALVVSDYSLACGACGIGSHGGGGYGVGAPFRPVCPPGLAGPGCFAPVRKFWRGAARVGLLPARLALGAARVGARIGVGAARVGVRIGIGSARLAFGRRFR